MSIRNLNKLFRPHRVAVVGASDQPGKVGHIVLANMVGHGFDGVVYPVNPRREAVQGIAAWPELAALPHVPDLAVICTPAEGVPALIEECGRLGIAGAVVISAGFREIGAAGRELERQIQEARARHPAVRIVGPNCLGMMVPSLKLNASFARGMPAAGRVAFLSQSGALCTSILDWASAASVGFSLFVSLGNMLDVDLADLLDYLAADPETDAVVMYIESIERAREFMSAARACSQTKPIVAYKAGRFAASAQAAASHTGAMAGVDAVYEAAMRRAGIVRVFDVDEMFDCAELLARQHCLKGPRLAIVTNAGGPGVMACDTLLERRGELAKLSPETIARLDVCLPKFWSHGNPVDILGDAPAARYQDAVRHTLADPGVDAALVLLTPQAMTEPEASAAGIVEAARGQSKPVLAAWMGNSSVQAGTARLTAAGIPAYPTPEHAVRAFLRLVEFQRNRELLYETPANVLVSCSLGHDELRRQLEEIRRQNPPLLGEEDSKRALALYGIPTAVPQPAESADEAARIAHEIGFPVVLKIRSPDITHKTDVGGVALDLASEGAVREAFQRIVDSARTSRPDAEIQGVAVQKMLTAVHGIELILGMKRDPVFGPVIMVGFGGVAAEVFQDRALELPPLNERLARKMLESLKAWPLLNGYRGRPLVDVRGLIEVLLRFSSLVADLPDLDEADINPLLVTSNEVVALDARLAFRGPPDRELPRSRHLAISPYPDEFTESVILKDGTPVALRALRPEDEPEWVDLLRRSSRESIWKRFCYLFKDATHEMAARFCSVDYDRELPLAAEAEVDGTRKLVAVARLVSDPDGREAEYGILVADAFQHRGLGRLLTQKCVEIARSRGVETFRGETAQDNLAMIHIFQSLGFSMAGARSDTVLAVLPL